MSTRSNRGAEYQADALVGWLRGGECGLGSGLWLLFARRLLALLLLLLIGERGESARHLADLYVAEGHRELAHVVLEEGGVERLALVPLDDVLDDLV